MSRRWYAFCKYHPGLDLLFNHKSRESTVGKWNRTTRWEGPPRGKGECPWRIKIVLHPLRVFSTLADRVLLCESYPTLLLGFFLVFLKDRVKIIRIIVASFEHWRSSHQLFSLSCCSELAYWTFHKRLSESDERHCGACILKDTQI